MKRWLPHIGIALGLLIATYAIFFSSSEEDRIRALLDRLEDAVALRDTNTNMVIRGAKVRKEFAAIFIKEVSFEVPELRSKGSGRRSLVKLATAAPRLYSTATVDLDGLAVSLKNDEQSAVATGEAIIQGTRHGHGLQRDTRAVAINLTQVEGEWRITRLSVGPRQDAPSLPAL